MEHLDHAAGIDRFVDLGLHPNKGEVLVAYPEDSLKWQRLPSFRKLAGTLTNHLEGILNYCRHKVPFGVVEAINANIRSMIRRGRGYRDHEYLILKLQKSTARGRLERAA